MYTDREDWDKMSKVACSQTVSTQRSLATQRLDRETRVWNKLNHPNVLPFLGISNDVGGEGSAPALITPLCTNGHVLDYLTHHHEADRLKLVSHFR
jgi:hypothetical protein